MGLPMPLALKAGPDGGSGVPLQSTDTKESPSGERR